MMFTLNQLNENTTKIIVNAAGRPGVVTSYFLSIYQVVVWYNKNVQSSNILSFPLVSCYVWTPYKWWPVWVYTVQQGV